MVPIARQDGVQGRCQPSGPMWCLTQSGRTARPAWQTEGTSGLHSAGVGPRLGAGRVLNRLEGCRGRATVPRLERAGRPPGALRHRPPCGSAASKKFRHSSRIRSAATRMGCSSFRQASMNDLSGSALAERASSRNSSIERLRAKYGSVMRRIVPSAAASTPSDGVFLYSRVRMPEVI